MKPALTVKQLELLNALRRYETEHPNGPGPTLAILGDMIGIKKSSVGRTLAVLRSKGWVHGQVGHGRSWQVNEGMKVFIGIDGIDANRTPCLIVATDEAHARALTLPTTRITEVDVSKPANILII